MKTNAHPIILFDGVCDLCNRAVQFVIRHDRRGIFHFASLQSHTAKKLIPEHLLKSGFDSFILIEEGKIYTQSTAALKTAYRLDGMIKLLYGFIIVPAFIRNAIYNLIARNRYKWFGKRQECMIPSPDIRSRFLD